MIGHKRRVLILGVSQEEGIGTYSGMNTPATDRYRMGSTNSTASFYSARVTLIISDWDGTVSS